MREHDEQRKIEVITRSAKTKKEMCAEHDSEGRIARRPIKREEEASIGKDGNGLVVNVQMCTYV